MSSPRVLLAVPAYYPEFAGGALQFRRYLPGLVERGIDVTVYAGTMYDRAGLDGNTHAASADNHDLRGQMDRRVSTDRVDGIPVHRVHLEGSCVIGKQLRFFRSVPRFCAGIDPRPDLVQFLTLPIDSLLALERLRRFGIRTVYSGMMVARLNGGVLGRALRRQIRGLPMRRVDRVIAGGDAMMEYFLQLGAAPPVEIIPPGVDLRRFRPVANSNEKRRLRRELAVPETARILLFVGSVVPRKGADLLFEAWARLASRHSDVILVIVGPGPKIPEDHAEFAARLDSLVRESGAANRVRFTGLVPNVEEYMRAADMLVFPSRREGAPNAVVEAMASGLPVVQTRYIGLPAEFGRPDVHYLLSGLDATGLASSIESLLASEDLRRALGESGRKWVEEHMDLDLIVDRYAALYRELVS